MNQQFAKIDEMILNEKIHDAYKMLSESYRNTKNPECAWRLAQCCYNLIYHQPQKVSKSEHKQIAQEGYDYCLEALQTSPNHSRCLTFAGICLDLLSRVEGLDDRIKNSFTMQAYWKKSEEIEPDYYVTHNCLGTWCFIVADLSDIKRKLAAAFFTKPPKSTYEEALFHLEKCYHLSPITIISNLLYLAKCYKHLKYYDKAREFCHKILDFPKNYYEAVEAKEEAHRMLEKL